ncbi:MAG TPA: GNAT family N-acetyltransferase [Rhizomicrobium sp.]|jgi:GNAT superfamily N-acetyltransferase|nr:GNAT family N-acetyltransferase [Rhizomicrobium sp.]
MSFKRQDNNPPKRIPTVVTFLEMKAKPSLIAPLPKGKVAILRAEHPPMHFYRYLYDTIGREYYWVDRKKVDDAALAAILQDPKVELYVMHVDGCPAGMAELDFRSEDTGNLAYFGLMPEYLGRGLGFFFLRQSIEIAWAKPISKFLVNTCTLDHPRALPLYQRAGFVPYSREDRYIELP